MLKTFYLPKAIFSNVVSVYYNTLVPKLSVAAAEISCLGRVLMLWM